MITTLFLLLGLAVVMLAGGIKHTSRVHNTITKNVKKIHVSQAVSVLLITVQFGELTRVLEHASIVNITASVLILSVLLATKSGTEGELH